MWGGVGMSQAEASVAWRLFSYNWVMIGLMGLALTTALRARSRSPKLSSLIWPFCVCSAYISVAYYKGTPKAERLTSGLHPRLDRADSSHSRLDDAADLHRGIRRPPF
jgi:hypothetical protein